MRWQILGRGNDILSILFSNRGLKNKKQQTEFLRPKKPSQLTLREVGLKKAEIKKALSRLKKAIKNKEKIIVYGDYDADGICATAVVWEALYQLGADVMPFVPQRSEGYGLKIKRLDQLAKEGIGLIITVDQGIVQFKQLKHAAKIGLDVIVTDHHVLGKKAPSCLAIIHTTQLAGVGVAWFFVREILKALGQKKVASLDLAGIGSITDMVPLLGPNRSLVRYGLQALRQTKRIGLQALFQTAGLDQKSIGTFEVGYLIGPRINASGRIQDAMEPLRLLCLHSDGPRALTISRQLEQANQARQQLTEKTRLHARQLWLAQAETSQLIFIQHQTYNEGVIGLVAQKLREEFYRPVIVIAESKGFSRASARSIDEFNMIEAIRSCADLLASHGGHPLAAGFDVATENISLLKERLQALAETQLASQKLHKTLKIDLELPLPKLNLKLLKLLNRFEPFGQKNPQPVFAARDVKVLEAQRLGRDQSHLKLQLAQDGVSFDAIGFGLGHFYKKLSPKKPIDIAYQLEFNHWHGRSSLQLKLKDIKSTV